MKIIDKNKDYYDFYQGIYRDNTLTFDRTKSFILTKEDIKHKVFIRGFSWGSRSPIRPKLPAYGFFLMQVCNTFWLFMAEVTKVNSYEVVDCNITMVQSWKNYHKKRKLISIHSFKLPYPLLRINDTKEDILKRLPAIVQAIDHNDYEAWMSLSCGEITLGNGEKEERDIPILKESGIASLVEPLDIYLSFEEYFSAEKTASERQESVGLTNKEKIENHGFNSKTSFRG